MYLGISSHICAYLCISGHICAYLGISCVSVCIWPYLCVSVRIWAYRVYLGISGHICAYLCEHPGADSGAESDPKRSKARFYSYRLPFRLRFGSFPASFPFVDCLRGVVSALPRWYTCPRPGLLNSRHTIYGPTIGVQVTPLGARRVSRSAGSIRRSPVFRRAWRSVNLRHPRPAGSARISHG